jgi:hypothetical protein
VLVHARAECVHVWVGGWVGARVLGGNGGLSIVHAGQYIENIFYRENILQSHMYWAVREV